MDKQIEPLENLNAANYTGGGRACQGLLIKDLPCLRKKKEVGAAWGVEQVAIAARTLLWPVAPDLY